jgi:hypothetical protein
VATPTVLVINAGSSSVTSGLFTIAEPPQPLARQTIDIRGASYLPRLLQWVDSHAGHVAGIGHRIVHGGPSHREPLLLTQTVLRELHQLIPFGPNHLPDEIALVERTADRHPDIAQYACFDTAFHADLPDIARRLPIPAAYDAQGIRRYGFHGLSYTYLLEEFRRLAGPEASAGRLVFAHLGVSIRFFISARPTLSGASVAPITATMRGAKNVRSGRSRRSTWLGGFMGDGISNISTSRSGQSRIKPRRRGPRQYHSPQMHGAGQWHVA